MSGTNRMIRTGVYVALLSTSTLPAETTVIEGEINQPPPRTLASPVTLEAPIAPPDPNSGGVIGTIRDVGHYVCKGVSLRTAIVSVDYWKSTARMTIRVFTYTERGQDKFVRVKADLLDGDSVLATGWIQEIDAEEGKNSSGITVIKIPKPLLLSKVPEKLRLTMYVEE